ncbi:ATP-binding protein [Bacterioplanes sanyensis]|uniref:AAA family ATPase n=1 Tax=Bacterioplanes sanyensis TaxID=1249553 RepID=UPI00167800BC|nr:AAA family ATPase [Bacterioplanes sanyensis]GGY59879.1 ATP-binding protein [Bacterioplanes sanyensis]
MNNRVVFTGGPGSGKTSVIKFLEKLGYPSAKEVGRKIIKTQTERNGDALPWKDKVAFRDAMVLEELNNYKVHDNSTLTFFDRCIIDSYGYSQLKQIAISEILLRSCRELTYHRKVFIFPPWETIYENDIERKQDFNEAVATYHEMVKAYERFGYELIEVPKVSVEERAQFIVSKLSDR